MCGHTARNKWNQKKNPDLKTASPVLFLMQLFWGKACRDGQVGRRLFQRFGIKWHSSKIFRETF